jgi:hypothetical protein
MVIRLRHFWSSWLPLSRKTNTAAAAAKYLIVRPEDFLVIGVKWSGFDVYRDADDNLMLKAGNDALLTLTFPPQSIAEEKYSWTDPNPAWPNPPMKKARMAGVSTVAFRVSPGKWLDLTRAPEEFLSALLPEHATVEPALTSIEVPWGLFIAPEGSNVRSLHVQLPEKPEAARERKPVAVGLWRMQLFDSNGDEVDAKLRLRPLSLKDFDPPFDVAPLSLLDRRDILADSSSALPDGSRLELSTLGATFACEAQTAHQWQHKMVLGRDQHVRFVIRGILFPFGHEAAIVEQADRVFIGRFPFAKGVHTQGIPPPDIGPYEPPEKQDAPPGYAALEKVNTFVVTKPNKRQLADGTSIRYREFPFDQVEILEKTVSDFHDVRGAAYFTLRHGEKPYLFPVRLTSSQSSLTLHLPLIFVREGAGPVTIDQLLAEWGGSGAVSFSARNTDLVGAATPAEGDVHELSGMTITAVQHGSGFRPRVLDFVVDLPAARSLLGRAVPTKLNYTQDFLDRGEASEIAFAMDPALDIDLTTRKAKSGGLIAPKYTAGSLSRLRGPVDPRALLRHDDRDTLKAVYDGSTILGMPLGELIQLDQQPKAPKVTPILDGARTPVGATLEWKLALKNYGPLTALNGAEISLNARTRFKSGGGEETNTTCTVSNFRLRLPAKSVEPLLALDFERIAFTQVAGMSPAVDATIRDISFFGELKLVQELGKALQNLLGPSRPVIQTAPTGVQVRYAIPLPEVKAGAILISNAVGRIGVDIPFDRKPVTVSLDFASRDKPFNVSVPFFRGGGYIHVVLGDKGLAAFEFSMEFGASLAVDFFVAAGEVHALGGIRFVRGADNSFKIDAYIRFGGSLRVLGVVTLGTELVAILEYDEDQNRLVGSGAIVVDIDLTLYATSVRIDTGEWEIPGKPLELLPVPSLFAAASAPASVRIDTGEREIPGISPDLLPGPSPLAAASAPAEEPGLAAWREYLAAFKSYKS